MNNLKISHYLLIALGFLAVPSYFLLKETEIYKSFFPTEIYKNDYLKRNNKKMFDWVSRNVERSVEGADGWQHVDWQNYTPATISKNTSAETNLAGEGIAYLLNEAFLNARSRNLDPNLGDYVDRGILVHGIDSYDEVGYLFNPTGDYLASTYLQAQMDGDGSHYPIYNGTFHFYEKGTPSAGLVYKPLALLPPKSYSIFAAFPWDANSDERYLGTNTRASLLEKGFKDYRDLVQKAWDAGKSINLASVNGVNTVEDYVRGLMTDQPVWSLSATQEDFDKFWSIRYALVEFYKNKKGRKGHTSLSDEVLALAPQDFFYWNEVILRVNKTLYYPDMVAGIFYITVENPRYEHSAYYESPARELKPYNIHLKEAQKQQKLLFEREKVWKPILELKIDKVIQKQPIFTYNAEDQVMNV